jgi:hypothetical protein
LKRFKGYRLQAFPFPTKALLLLEQYTAISPLKTKLTLLFWLIGLVAFAQKQDRIWCFGLGAGIDFNDTLNPIPFSSATTSHAFLTYSSIADNNGNLLFYAAGIDWDTLGIHVWNRNHNIMQNGDSIAGHPNSGQHCMIIPFPADSTKYYLISASYLSGMTTLCYSVIDMLQAGGLGAVTQKNIFLLYDALSEKLNALKHANGRDWWVITRRYPDNTYYKFLISPSGISGPYMQNIGTADGTMFFGTMDFTMDGDRLAAVSIWADIDLMDFDRCSGTLSNFIDLGEHITSPQRWYYSSAFSNDKTKLYVAATNNNITDPKYIYQYDLTAANIMASKQTAYSYVDTIYNFFLGEIKLAPDGKIYIAKGGGPNPNTVYDQNLDYITYPDSLGAACGYCSNCFSLQGHGLNELGLPNIPNYNLGSLTGSPCDSLTLVIQNIPPVVNELFIYYDSGWQTAFINAKDLKGRNYSLSVFDLTGREVYKEEGTTSSYYTKDLNCSTFANGMYIVTLQTEKEKLVKKFVKE